MGWYFWEADPNECLAFSCVGAQVNRQVLLPPLNALNQFVFHPSVRSTNSPHYRPGRTVSRDGLKNQLQLMQLGTERNYLQIPDSEPSP